MIRFLLIAFFLSLSACSNVKFGANDDAIKGIDNGKVILEVNGKKFHEGYLEYLGRINPRLKAQLENPSARKQLVHNIAEQELMYQDAIKRGIDKKADVNEKLSMVRKMVVTQSLLEDQVEVQAKKYYEEKKDSEFTKVGISLIQVAFAVDEPKDKPAQPNAVPTPTQAQKDAALAEAKAARERLLKGEDFAKVAEEVSDDKVSKRKGGDYGEISRGDRRLERHQMAVLGDAAFKMKAGEISEVIETPKGYCIIKVTSEPKVTPFEEAENLIRFQVQGTVKDQLIAELTQKGKVVYPEDKEPEAKPAAAETPLPAPEGAPAEVPTAAPVSPPPAPPAGQ